MKFKTSAIALAVAGTVAAPVAVQAGADEIYASARIGIWNVDEGGASDLELRSFSSRFGAQGETDLGNGMTAYGRYEWDVDLNDEANTEALSVRHRYVGLKGDFGDIRMGQGAQTFYNHAVSKIDLPWWHVGYAMVSYPNRTDNALTYSGSTGAVSFGVTAYFTNLDSGEDSPDGMEFGATFPIGDMSLGVAVKTTAEDDAGAGAAAVAATEAGSIGTDPDGDENIIAVALGGIMLGDASLSLMFQTQDDDSSLTAHLGIGNAYVHLESLSLDAADADPLGITLGYTQSLGRKTTMYYEYWNLDPDVSGVDDSTHIMAVLKYDII